MSLNYGLVAIYTILFLTACGKTNRHDSTEPIGIQKSSSKLSTRIIYGNDDRKDLYEVNDQQLVEWASSTVALVDENNIEELSGDFVHLKTKKFGAKYSLCDTEPYREQPIAAFCSGFLVKEDVIITAWHCVNSTAKCNKTKFVFGFAMNSFSDDPVIINTKDVYNCKELIRSEVNGKGADFAVVKLDRKVTDRLPLKLRQTGFLTVGTNVTVIGHPTGIPTKIADGAQVRMLNQSFFRTNLDTYGGNSGSAVFNSLTGEVEGVLVRGDIDFVYKNGCRVSKVCKSNECRGEDVT
ncbi:MAG: trypsin-like peptidase domain-containing protein, partial [Bdellovibrionales bacterium]|nr:trypsin-like peptidase domain-containing protein [Bdellovibrionales bacterium]